MRFVCGLALAGSLSVSAAAEEVTPVTPAAPAATEAAAAPEPARSAPGLQIDLPPLPHDSFSAAAAFSDRPFGDGRRTLSAFPKNLGRNFVGVFSRDNLAPFLLGGAVAAAGNALDDRAASLMLGRCTSCGRTGATVGGVAIVPVVGLFFTAGRLAPASSTFRAASYDAAQALLVNGAWTGVLKHSLQRQRPDGLDSLSLPSGHASTSFAIATVVERHYGWKAGLPAYALAAGIGLSRIESNRHHLSDVLAGAAIGTIVGRTVTRLNGERPSTGRSFAVAPATDAQGTGIGIGVSASW